MSDPTQLETDGYTGSLQLIHALNAIATTLQKSIAGEENIYSVFQDKWLGWG